jgi:dTDP-4-amino-4,6-dideoxygalactose transaminase
VTATAGPGSPRRPRSGSAGPGTGPGYQIPITRPWLPPFADYSRLLERVWSSKMLSNFGPLAVELEAQSRVYLGAGHLLSASSGDVALILAVRALGLPAGSRVLVPSFTFNSTINSIVWNGHRPVFVDIDADTLNMDPHSAAERVDGAAAIVATHVFGSPADVDALAAIARRAGVPLLFDAAHGYGSLYRGRHVGTLGAAEVFSLSGTKPVTSGEGGLFATEDPELASRFRYLRAYGFQDDYVSHYVGLNGKLSELHAALGLLTMARVEDALATRRRHVAAYLARLAVLPGVGFQKIAPADRSTYKDFALLFRDGSLRNSVEVALTARGIQTKRYFRPCHDMPAYREFCDRPLPQTDSAYARVLCVPLFEDMTDAQRDLVCDVIGEAVSKRPRAHRRGHGEVAAAYHTPAA